MAKSIFSLCEGSLWLSCIVSLSLPHGNTALPEGATVKTCQHMTPIHGSSRPQVTASVFSVDVGKLTYSPDDRIRVSCYTSMKESRRVTCTKRTVTLQAHCGRMFKGFLLEARSVESDGDNVTLLGSFNSPEGTQVVEGCGTPGQVMTHKGPSPRSAVDFEWTAPSTPSGQVVMTVTFVETYSFFWTNVLSAVLSDFNSSSTVDDTNKTYPTSWTCPDKMQHIHLCDTPSCQVLVSWGEVMEDFVTFHLSVFVADGQKKWVAIGLSDDTSMGNDSVIECVSYDKEAKIYPSFNQIDGKRNNRLQPGTDDIVTRNFSLSLHDGILHCSFQRKLSVRDGRVFSLNYPWFLLVAWGNTYIDSDDKEVHTKRPVFTLNPVTFVRSENQGTTTTSPNSSFSYRPKGLFLAICFVWAYIILII